MPPTRIVETVDVVGERGVGGLVSEIIVLIDPFGLQGREEALGDRVVVAVAGSAHARDHAPFGERGAVVVAGVRATAVRVVDEPGRRPTALQRVVECSEGQRSIIRVAGRPTDDASGEKVEQHGEVQPAPRSRDEGDIADPRHVGRLHFEPTLEDVGRDGLVVLGVGGAHEAPLAPPSEAGLAHQPLDALLADARSVAGMKEAVVQAVGTAEHVIAAVYVVPTAGKAVRAAGGGLKNTVAMDDATGSLLATVLDRAAERTVVLAMGNPYVIEDFPAIQNYVCAFSNVTVSETAAIKELFGEIPITGHLPITIPGFAALGDGIQLPATHPPQKGL